MYPDEPTILPIENKFLTNICCFIASAIGLAIQLAITPIEVLLEISHLNELQVHKHE